MVNQQVNCSKPAKSSPINNNLVKCIVIRWFQWPSVCQNLSISRSTKLVAIICLCLTIGYFIGTSSDYAVSVAFYLIRLILLKVKLFWDWSYVAQNRCLLFNNQPSILIKQAGKVESSGRKLHGLPFPCYSCQDLIQIKRLILSAHSRDSIEFDIFNRVPFIVSPDNNTQNNTANPIQSWPIFSNPQPPIETLSKIYSTLNDHDVCMFASNIQVASPNMLFSHLNRHPEPWFAHWENCVSRSRKSIRKLYKRPDFIPNFIELTHPSWVLAADYNFTAKTWKYIDMVKSTKIGIVIQIFGQNRFKLVPKNDCYRFGCDPIEAIISASNFLFYSTELWKLSYLPANSSFNLALVLGGSYETY